MVKIYEIMHESACLKKMGIFSKLSSFGPSTKTFLARQWYLYRINNFYKVRLLAILTTLLTKYFYDGKHIHLKKGFVPQKFFNK